MRAFIASSATLAVLAAPAVSLAACNDSQGLCMVLGKFGDLIQTVTPIVVALALLAFFWGLAMYMLNLGTEGDKDKKKGRDLMMYGVLTLFVIVSVWGLVQILQATFLPNGTNTGSAPPVPYLIPSR